MSFKVESLFGYGEGLCWRTCTSSLYIFDRLVVDMHSEHGGRSVGGRPVTGWLFILQIVP